MQERIYIYIYIIYYIYILTYRYNQSYIHVCIYIYIYTLIHIISTFTATCIYTLFIVIYNRHALISSTYITILFFLQPIIYQYIYIAVQVPYNVCVCIKSTGFCKRRGGPQFSADPPCVAPKLFPSEGSLFHVRKSLLKYNVCMCIYLYIHM